MVSALDTINTKSSDPAIGAAAGSAVENIIVNGGSINAVSTGDNSNEVLGAFSSNASVDNVIFRGGNIHLETQAGGVAVDRWAQVPESGFSNADKVYDFNQANFVPTRINVFHSALTIHTGDKSNQMHDFICYGKIEFHLGVDNVHGDESGFVFGHFNREMAIHDFYCFHSYEIFFLVEFLNFHEQHISDFNAVANAINSHMYMVSQGNVNAVI